LRGEGIRVTVWDVRVVSEPDQAMLDDAARHRVVITAEDGIRQGGAGMFVADALRSSVGDGVAPPVIALGTPRSFIAQDKPDRILAALGLDGHGLARSAREALGAIGEEPHGSGPAGPSAPLPATVITNDVLD
jgi:1-deoxy-D-xylulose-5-phosphate synthase